MIAESLLVFTVTWWIALFVSLPICVEVDESENRPKGCASSSPKKAHLLIKVSIVTGISVAITALYCYMKHLGYVDALFAILYKLSP